MNVTQVISLARKHLGGSMESSARVCLADAISLNDRGDLQAAKARALKSLRYSIGMLAPAYKRASKGMDLAETNREEYRRAAQAAW